MTDKLKDMTERAVVKASRSPIGAVRGDAPAGESLAEGLRRLGIQRLGRQAIDLPAVEIGERIRKARQMRGLTQAELAGRIGCKQGDLSDIERGKGRDGPSYRTLKALAEALDIELPINPPAHDDADSLVVVEVRDGAQVEKGVSAYDTCRVMLSQDEWRVLRSSTRRIRDLLPKSHGPTPSCTVLTVPPATKALFTTDDFSVLVALRGNAHVRCHRAMYRAVGFTAGRVVAVVDPTGSVEVETTDETSSMMFMPAGVLMAHEAGEDCDA